MSAIFVFNQYYIDLLKKLKHISKKNKDNSSTAKKVLKAIKDNYVTFDKSYEPYNNASPNLLDWKFGLIVLFWNPLVIILPCPPVKVLISFQALVLTILL
jgi:hypothetical protein